MLNTERDELLEEIYELVHENNKMLRAEKRARLFSGLVKIIWMVLVIGVPVWLYFNYLAPILDNMQASIAQLEGLTKVNPQLEEKVEPIIKTLQTLVNLFGNKVAR